MVLNYLSFCLSVKLLISPSYLNEFIAGYSNLGCRFFSFITLHMPCLSLLAWRVSIERSAVILMGILLCVFCCFSLAAFNICSLCLILWIWLISILGCSALGLSCLVLSGFLSLGWLFPSPFREVFNCYLLKYFLKAFLFVFFFWNSYDSNVGVFDMVPVVSEVVLISFNSCFLSASFMSTILSSTSLILSSDSSYSTVGSLQVFLFFYLIYCIIHYWLTF